MLQGVVAIHFLSGSFRFDTVLYFILFFYYFQIFAADATGWIGEDLRLCVDVLVAVQVHPHQRAHHCRRAARDFAALL